MAYILLHIVDTGRLLYLKIFSCPIFQILTGSKEGKPKPSRGFEAEMYTLHTNATKCETKILVTEPNLISP